MLTEVEQNMEVVIPGEHATRKTSRKQIMELRSISNNDNASSSTTCTLMAQQDEELMVHHGANGIFLNCTRITAVGQYTASQAGYLNVPQAPLINSLQIGQSNPLIALSDQSHVVNVNFEGAVANNTNSTYLVCMSNMAPSSSQCIANVQPNVQPVIMPQFNNNQICLSGFIPNTTKEIAVPMIQSSHTPDIVLLSDDSNENEKSMELPSDGDDDNGTSQKEISTQNKAKDIENPDKDICCIPQSMIDSDDVSNGLSEFIVISKPNNNSISENTPNDSDDVILFYSNEKLNVQNINDEIKDLQTFSTLNESSNSSSASKSTKCSSSRSTLSLNRNESFLSKPSCSQECDKEFDKLLDRESGLNNDKSKDKIPAKQVLYEDLTSGRHEKSNENKSCTDLDSDISYTLDETVSTVLENEVADDLVELLSGLDSCSEENSSRSVHSQNASSIISELPDLSEYNVDSDNTTVGADNNVEAEKTNSDSNFEKRDMLNLKSLKVTMEPSEYKKDACYFMEFLKLDYSGTNSQESDVSIQQEKSYRAAKQEDENMLCDDTSADLRLESLYHGLFKSNVMRQSILNPCFSNRTLLEYDMCTMSISVKHEAGARGKKNKGKKRVHQSDDVTIETRRDKISCRENSKRKTCNSVFSAGSNYLVKPVTFPSANSSTLTTDNSDVKKRTRHLRDESRNEAVPYSCCRRSSRRRCPSKRNLVASQMEDSLVNHTDDFLQYPSEDERRLENHSQLATANSEDLGRWKSSPGFVKRVVNLISEANTWLPDITTRERTRSQSKNKQNEADRQNKSSINGQDSARTVVEVPAIKITKSQFNTAQVKNSKKSISPDKTIITESSDDKLEMEDKVIDKCCWSDPRSKRVSAASKRTLKRLNKSRITKKK